MKTLLNSAALLVLLVACKDEAGYVAPYTAVCGNGVLEGFEMCDDGNASDCGPCNKTCSSTGTGFRCGDGEVCEGYEVCDPGPVGAACSDCAADCKSFVTATAADVDDDGVLNPGCGGIDCDDAVATTFPGAADHCADGVDSDCSGVTDPVAIPGARVDDGIPGDDRFLFFDSTTHEAALFWNDENATTPGLYLRHLDATGTPLAASARVGAAADDVVQTPDGFALVRVLGLTVELSTLSWSGVAGATTATLGYPGNQTLVPRLAWNGELFGVAWLDNANLDMASARFQRVGADLVPIGDSASLSMGPITTRYAGVLLSTADEFVFAAETRSSEFLGYTQHTVLTIPAAGQSIPFDKPSVLDPTPTGLEIARYAVWADAVAVTSWDDYLGLYVWRIGPDPTVATSLLPPITSGRAVDSATVLAGPNGTLDVYWRAPDDTGSGSHLVHAVLGTRGELVGEPLTVMSLTGSAQDLRVHRAATGAQDVWVTWLDTGGLYLAAPGCVPP